MQCRSRVMASSDPGGRYPLVYRPPNAALPWGNVQTGASVPAKPPKAARGADVSAPLGNCTACGCDAQADATGAPRLHPKLAVLLCERCFDRSTRVFPIDVRTQPTGLPPLRTPVSQRHTHRVQVPGRAGGRLRNAVSLVWYGRRSGRLRPLHQRILRAVHRAQPRPGAVGRGEEAEGVGVLLVRPCADCAAALGQRADRC